MKSLLTLPWIIAAAISCVLVGCSAMEVADEMRIEAAKIMTGPPKGERETIFEGGDTDEWSVVRDEGREGQESEIDPDQWWRKYFMSAEARRIERNLGYE